MIDSNIIFNIRNVETEFKVNKDKRTVVCIITAINEIPRRVQKYGLADEEYDYTDFDVRIYKGIAKCSKEDQWDERYGRRLAEYRATKARKADVNEELKKYIKSSRIKLDNLEKYGLIKEPHKPEEN